jgi:hypothetical protein
VIETGATTVVVPRVKAKKLTYVNLRVISRAELTQRFPNATLLVRPNSKKPTEWLLLPGQYATYEQSLGWQGLFLGDIPQNKISKTENGVIYLSTDWNPPALVVGFTDKPASHFLMLGWNRP